MAPVKVGTTSRQNEVAGTGDNYPGTTTQSTPPKGKQQKLWTSLEKTTKKLFAPQLRKVLVENTNQPGIDWIWNWRFMKTPLWSSVSAARANQRPTNPCLRCIKQMITNENNNPCSSVSAARANQTPTNPCLQCIKRKMRTTLDGRRCLLPVLIRHRRTLVTMY